MMNRIKMYFWRGPGFKNLGDELGPYIVQHLSGLEVIPVSELDKDCMFSVGSILGQATHDSQVVWGSGFMHSVSYLKVVPNIFAVRGPLSLGKLPFQRIPVGDPALLLPRIFPFEVSDADKKYEIGIIPHYIDQGYFMKYFVADLDFPYTILNIAHGNVEGFVQRVCECEYIVTSTLHGLIVAQAYNIPALWVEFSDKVLGSGFKFHDYFLSVGIPPYIPARLTGESLRLSVLERLIRKSSCSLRIVNFCSEGLVNSFGLSLRFMEQGGSYFSD